jgi:ArsR family transcriptional regulator
MNPAQLERIAKALADTTRLRILEEISSRPQMTCGDIVSMRGVTPATVSHHLKILYDAGLIRCRKKGRFVYSCVVPEAIEAYAAGLAEIVRKRKRKKRR